MPVASGGEAPAPAAAERPPEEVVAPRLVFDLPPDLFKNAWRKPGKASADFATEPERQQWEPVLAAELQKYPKDLFDDRFAVYACAVAYLNDLPVAGTFWWRGVIVSIKSNDPIATLHHEMGSWLFYRYAEHFSKPIWLQTNPPGFQYSEDAMAAAQAIVEGRRRFEAIEEDQLPSGFLNHYCRTSLANDFSETAAQLFSNEPRFWEAVERHDALAQKVRLAIRFYEQVDERYSEEYFRSLPR